MNSMWILLAFVVVAMLVTRAKEAYAYKWRGWRHVRRPAPVAYVNEWGGWRHVRRPAPVAYVNEWGQYSGTQVEIFTGKNFDGQRVEFPVGEHTNMLSYSTNIRGVGGNNSIGSIRVPIGHVVRVYSEPEFQGKTGIFLAGNHRLGWRWLNNIGSMIVVKGNVNAVSSGWGVTGL